MQQVMQLQLAVLVEMVALEEREERVGPVLLE
jgi:hypothetical protein